MADDLVAYVLPNGPEFIALTFGIYRVGATPAPLAPKLTEREITAIIATMQPAIIIGEHPALVGRILTAPGPADSRDYPAPAVSASWKACTSGGSTGRPKVIIDGRPAQFDDTTEFIDIPADDCVFIPGPLYHNAPFSAAIFALWRGSSVVTMPRFDAAEAVGVIARERAGWALMVPTMMHRILRLAPSELDAVDLSAWSRVVHTAAPMADSTKRAWIARFGADHIWEVYGATEGLLRTWIGGDEWLEHPGSVGRPIGGSRIRIIGAYGRDMAVGEEGEVYAMPGGGPGSTYRYIGADRRATDGGWESVGDVGHLDQDGYLFLADRRADMIISGGVNIWPAEVEAALLEHPAVQSCAVFGVPDDDLGEHVHAVVETDDARLDLKTLQTFLRASLSGERLPRSLTCVKQPVRDDAGKVRKSDWQAMLRT